MGDPETATAAKLSVASGADNTTPAGVNAELDERIASALERVAQRTHTPALDVDVEADAEDAIVVPELAPADPAAVPADTPGPGAARAPRPTRDCQGREREQRRIFFGRWC